MLGPPTGTSTEATPFRSVEAMTQFLAKIPEFLSYSMSFFRLHGFHDPSVSPLQLCGQDFCGVCPQSTCRETVRIQQSIVIGSLKSRNRYFGQRTSGDGVRIPVEE